MDKFELSKVSPASVFLEFFGLTRKPGALLIYGAWKGVFFWNACVFSAEADFSGAGFRAEQLSIYFTIPI